MRAAGSRIRPIAVCENLPRRRSRVARPSPVVIVLLALFAATWLSCSALCALKGRRAYAVGNLLVVGALAGWAGATRLPRPESGWPRRFYSPDKLEQAKRRHTIYIRGYPR